MMIPFVPPPPPFFHSHSVCHSKKMKLSSAIIVGVAAGLLFAATATAELNFYIWEAPAGTLNFEAAGSLTGLPASTEDKTCGGTLCLLNLVYPFSSLYLSGSGPRHRAAQV